MTEEKFPKDISIKDLVLVLLFFGVLALVIDNYTNVNVKGTYLDRTDKIEKYLNLDSYCFRGYCVNDNMTLKEVRIFYYTYKPYPFHADLVNTIASDICGD